MFHDGDLKAILRKPKRGGGTHHAPADNDDFNWLICHGHFILKQSPFSLPDFSPPDVFASPLVTNPSKHYNTRPK
ncbi:hypothetical protein BN129_4417 [Cronobacter sakazakii 701]|nr:hypothetical protein BN129_4417 [Cronobacter sakazakii 701]